jgi:L-rhamnose isomerase
MIDQSHNLKGKIEAMIQTVTMAQELYCKAALVNHEELARAQAQCELVKAESLMQDVAPVKGLAAKPHAGFSRKWLLGAHHYGKVGAKLANCHFL